jgi:K+-transporting ATPase KdpF subunit
MPPDNFNSSIFIFPLHLKGKSLQNFYIVSANLHIIKTNLYGGGDGYRIYRGNRCILAGNLCVRRRMRQAGGTSMNTFYVIGAVVSAGLLVYLVMALLKAENL